MTRAENIADYLSTEELTCIDAMLARDLMLLGILESATTAMCAAAVFAQSAQGVPMKHPLPKHHLVQPMRSMCSVTGHTYNTT